nr:hypothetical protein HK105_004020 [Polyrhizophydium stewartii]
MSAIHCFFCGGKECKYENWRLWTPDKYAGVNAIDGLYSSWITDDILAMQRPSTRLINEYGLVKKFQECGIRSIFNLQESGEHASCGDGIEPSSGFSYLPETWMDNGIFYYNFGWTDMDTPDNETMMNIVQVMSYALESRKKTKKQVLFVSSFEEYLGRLRLVFPRCTIKSQREPHKVESFTLQKLLEHQKKYLHGVEQRNLRSVPKESCTVNVHRMLSAFLSFEGIAKFEPKMIAFQADINDGYWGVVENEFDVAFLVTLLLHFITSLRSPLVSNEQIEAIERKQGNMKDAVMQIDRDVFQTTNFLLSLFRKSYVLMEVEDPPSSLAPLVELLRYIYKAYTCVDETRAMSVESFSIVHDASPALNIVDYVSRDGHNSLENLARTRRDKTRDKDDGVAMSIKSATNLVLSAINTVASSAGVSSSQNALPHGNSSEKPSSSVPELSEPSAQASRKREASAKDQLSLKTSLSISGLRSVIPSFGSAYTASNDTKEHKSGDTETSGADRAPRKDSLFGGISQIPHSETIEFLEISNFIERLAEMKLIPDGQRDHLSQLCSDRDQRLATIYTAYGENGINRESDESYATFITSCNQMAPAPSQTFYHFVVLPADPRFATSAGAGSGGDVDAALSPNRAREGSVTKKRVRTPSNSKRLDPSANFARMREGCVVLRDWPRKRMSQSWSRSGMLNPGQKIVSFQDFLDGELKDELTYLFGEMKYRQARVDERYV